MRSIVTVVGLAAGVLVVSGCGGYGSSPPSAPTAPTPRPSAVVVDVIGIDGPRSFAPNPATVPAGQLVVWHNADRVEHRIVFNDGELDTGLIPAGAYSEPSAVVAAGSYHCAIHPSMVGVVGGGQ